MWTINKCGPWNGVHLDWTIYWMGPEWTYADRSGPEWTVDQTHQQECILVSVLDWTADDCEMECTMDWTVD